MSVATMISILSLVPGGLGISEVSITQILKEFGFAPVDAQVGAIVLRLFSLVALAFGLIHLGAWKLIRTLRDKAVGKTASDELG
jgi:uncharacterized membrane protein YbhN (UPF0104 family)